jgi:hypothetical protein
MSEPYEVVAHKGMTIKFWQDTTAEGPRGDTQFGTMIHWHRTYVLGDRSLNPEEQTAIEHGGPEALVKHLKRAGATEVLPLGLLDHSGLHMWVGGGSHFTDSAGWDSGTVGFIFDTPQGREDTGVDPERTVEALKAEVLEYDQYLTGDIWGYEITDARGKSIGGCWGMYGIDDCRTEAIAEADALLKLDPEIGIKHEYSVAALDPSAILDFNQHAVTDESDVVVAVCFSGLHAMMIAEALNG